MSYNWSQQMALVLVPKFTATLGIFCSSFIISEIRSDHQKNEGNPIKRALLGVCFFEISDATGWWLSSWAVPSDSGFALASGTQGSCSFQGFLLQSGIGIVLYYALLTYFFSLIVRNNATAEKLEQMEMKFHVPILLYVFGSCFIMLFKQLFNPIGNVCWANGNPIGCGRSTMVESDVPCIRGEHAVWFGLCLFYFVLWIVIAVILYLNWVMRLSLMRQNSEDAQWVTTQALLFSLAFFVTWTPSTLWSFMHFTAGGGFWLDLLAVIFEPMQGFWNLLIFLRNRPDSIERLERILTCDFCRSDMEQDETGEDVANTLESEPSNIKRDETNIIDNSYGYDDKSPVK